MYATEHSLMRAQERTGKNRKAASHMIRLAFDRGIDYESMPELEKYYMENSERDYPKSKMLYYNGFLFAFSEGGACITMYKAPAWFMKKPMICGKERIRNIKKYMAFAAM